MARYIDADALKENLNEIARHSFTLDDGYQYFIKGLIRADDAINEIPTADVVEVVRCKDCKHFSMTTIGMPYACWHGYYNVFGETGENGGKTVCRRIDSPDFYCAYGERGEP